MTIEGAALDHPRQRELVEHRRAGVVELLLAPQRGDEALRQREPADPRPGASVLLAEPR